MGRASVTVGTLLGAGSMFSSEARGSWGRCVAHPRSHSYDCARIDDSPQRHPDRRSAAYHPDPDLDIIKKAYVYSAKVHQGQLRQVRRALPGPPAGGGGHPGASSSWTRRPSSPGSSTTPSRTPWPPPEELTELFGAGGRPARRRGHQALQVLGQPPRSRQEEKQAENFRKMIIAMAQDIRVILVKLADRTHNMRTLESHARGEAGQRIAQETLDIYAPLANRLGISWIKTELEDLSLPLPQARRSSPTSTERRRASARRSARSTSRTWSRLIEREAARSASSRRGVAGRFKHLYSIYKKMRAQGIDFEQVHDMIAFRLIMPTDAQLLRGAGADPPAVEAGAGALQGLHRHPQAQHVPVAAHHGDRPAGGARRGADPHRGDAPDRRGGHRRPLGLQGGQGAGQPATTRSSPGCAS